MSLLMGPTEFMIDGVNRFLASTDFESTARSIIKKTSMTAEERDKMKSSALATVLGYSPKHVVSSFSDILKM